MDNYEHEIKPINITSIKNFLRCDFFHDSDLKSIKTENNWKYIFITLSCERERRNDKNITNIWIDEILKSDKYDYIIHFSWCQYNCNNFIDSKYFNDYINWRFKNSAKLQFLQKMNKRKKLYHFRIQFNLWMFDIIFNKVTVSKIHGKAIWFRWKVWLSHFDYVKKEYSKYSLNELLDFAKNWDFPKRKMALEYLFLNNYKNIKELAINALSDEDAFISAIYILWEVWELADLKYLEKLSFLPDYQNKYRLTIIPHINDAIEKIFFRQIKLWENLK